MKKLGEMTLEELIVPSQRACACGRDHRVGLAYVKIGRDAVRFLPDAVKTLGCHKPFVVCDRHTRAAAMEAYGRRRGH